jgi:membrane-associated HD superfamily phosphohydrolase
MKSQEKKIDMNSKNKMKVIAVNAILFAALFGLVSLNKEFLRPILNQSKFLEIFTGCFPNCIAAYLISLASVSAVLIRKLNHGRLIVYTSSIVVFIILMIEELKPMWGASIYYDLFDIIASGIGSILAIITYELAIVIEKMQKSRKKNTINFPLFTN